MRGHPAQPNSDGRADRWGVLQKIKTIFKWSCSKEIKMAENKAKKTQISAVYTCETGRRNQCIRG